MGIHIGDLINARDNSLNENHVPAICPEWIECFGIERIRERNSDKNIDGLTRYLLKGEREIDTYFAYAYDEDEAFISIVLVKN